VVKDAAIVVDGIAESSGEGVGQVGQARVHLDEAGELCADLKARVSFYFNLEGWVGMALEETSGFALCGAGVEVRPPQLDLGASKCVR
jgi:hypothetical protein